MSNETTKQPRGVVITNTIGFALCFAVWVMLGPSSRSIAQEFGLSPGSAALLKAAPILTGATMRIPIGLLADRYGARAVFPALMWACAAAVASSSFAVSGAQMIAGAFVLGFIGTTFAVGVQSVSSWTPAAKQGAALGFFGAGNVGTALTTFGLPLLLAAYGWRGSFRVYACVLVVAGAYYWVAVRNAPRKGASPSVAALVAPMRSMRALRFGLYYMATFGIFVATTLTIGDIYIDGYKLSPKTAGILATTFTFSASLIRIYGGRLADRIGARTVVRSSMAVVVCALLPILAKPPLFMTVGLVFVAGLAMGIGAAGVFKYIPDYFPKSVGAVGGIVGAVGGVGGFVLPIMGGYVKALTGSPYMQVVPLIVVGSVGLVVQALATRASAAQPVLATVPSIVPPAAEAVPAKRAA